MKLILKSIKYIINSLFSFIVIVYFFLNKIIYSFLRFIVLKKVFILNILFATTSILLGVIAIFIAYPEYEENSRHNAIPNINGQWELSFETVESSYNTYIGNINTYNLFFIGDKNSYKFKGERTLVNGESQDFELRDRLEGEVIIEDGRLYVLYDLFGNRKTDGNFQGIFDDNFISFSGTFIGNAAETKGIVIGKRK